MPSLPGAAWTTVPERKGRISDGFLSGSHPASRMMARRASGELFPSSAARSRRRTCAPSRTVSSAADAARTVETASKASSWPSERAARGAQTARSAGPEGITPPGSSGASSLQEPADPSGRRRQRAAARVRAVRMVGMAPKERLRAPLPPSRSTRVDDEKRGKKKLPLSGRGLSL